MPRNCSYCNFAGHDIRNCMEYVNSIDRGLVRDFTRNGNTVFPELPRRMMYKLGDKYGLSRNLNYNLFLERLMLIYIHLGEQRRLEQTRQQQELPSFIIVDNSGSPIGNIVVPFPLVPAQNRFSRFLSTNDLNAIRETFQQLSQELEMEVIDRNRMQIDNSPIFVMDPSKFNSEQVQCDCPICYEKNDAVITNCAHSYCRPCMDSLITHANNNAPVCALCRETINTVFLYA